MRFLHRSWMIGLSLVWLSAPTITIGVHLQTQSVYFGQYQQYVVKNALGANNDSDYGPNMLLMEFAWPVVGVAMLIFATLFTIGMSIVKSVSLPGHVGSFCFACLFIVSTVISAAYCTVESIDAFCWGFTTLGIGYCASSFGLVMGCAAAIGIAVHGDYQYSRKASG